MSNSGPGNAGPGNSSNPRPGHSPFPQSSALIRTNPGSSPGTENSNNVYSSQYSNNFNRAESRYSTARNESIFGYYDYERNDARAKDSSSQPTPQNNQRVPADRTSSRYSEDEDEDVEEVQRDYTDQSPPRRNESAQSRYSPRPRSNASQRQSQRPTSETRFRFETPQTSQDDGADTGNSNHARVKVNIDFMNGAGSWTGTVPGNGGVSIDLGGGTWTPFGSSAGNNQRFGGGFPLGGPRLFNGSGFPVNLPFGL